MSEWLDHVQKQIYGDEPVPPCPDHCDTTEEHVHVPGFVLSTDEEDEALHQILEADAARYTDADWESFTELPSNTP